MDGWVKTPREVAFESFPWKQVRQEFSQSPLAERLLDHAEYRATAGEGMPAAQLRLLRSFYQQLIDENVVVEYSEPEGYAYRSRVEADGELIIRVNELAQMTPEAQIIWRFPRELPEAN